MLNDKTRVKEIIDVFNDSIREYNEKIASLSSEDFSGSSFVGSVGKFYTAMETALRAILNPPNSSIKFHELVEDFINRNADAIENIDLFYILRYRGDRNTAAHDLKISGQNPFPRLFLNGKKFILRYVDERAVIESWNTSTRDFDFADFSQMFSPEARVYDRIRVLVVGPMHDFSQDKLSLLGRYHFNIVLDFDPYSAKGGFRSAVDYSKVNYLDLSSFDAKAARRFSRETTEAVMCDGDFNAGVPSFTKGSLYLPSQLDGVNRNCWPFYCSGSNGREAFFLLQDFLKSYFKQIPSHVDLLFLIDFSEQTVPQLYEAVKNALNGMADINVFFIDETNSSNLDRMALNNGWAVYKTTLHKFLDKVGSNIGAPEVGSQYYIVAHDEKECDGKISAPEYDELTERFYLLHDRFPAVNDEVSESFADSMYQFSRGSDIRWSLISRGALGDLEIFRTIYGAVNTVLQKREQVFYLTHTAGFGGSTIAKHVAYRLSKTHPVLFLKAYDKNSFVDDFKRVYSFAKKLVVVFIESSVMNQTEKDDCINALKGTTMPHLIVFVERAVSQSEKEKVGRFVKTAIKNDVEKIINFNRDALSNHPDIFKDNKLLYI